MQKVDIFDFARRRHVMEGSLGLEDMPRLDAIVEGEGRSAHVRFTARGIPGEKGLPGVELAISGEIVTQCIRCGEPLSISLDTTVPFLFARTEAEADRMPVDEDGDWEVVTGSERFDVAAWVEEEVILSMPAFPRHDGCPPFSAGTGGSPEKGKYGAFSSLAFLMKTGNGCR